MSRVQQYQSSFSNGEIDPLLQGRIDLQQYYTSVATAKMFYLNLKVVLVGDQA